MQPPTRAAFIGAAIAAVMTLPGLGTGTLWDNSETAYGEVAREILRFHDVVVMHLNGTPWFVQPPLYFWIAAIFVKIFGLSSFALRLPSAVATIAMGAMIAYAVSRAAGVRAGLYATVILSTSLMQAVVGRLAIMDALLDLAVACTIFWWFRALQTGRAGYLYAGSAAAALGFLAKGPVAPVIALIVIVTFYFWNRRTAQTLVPPLNAIAVAIAIFALIVSPWFIALYVRTGSTSIGQLIGHYTFARYTSTIENQAGPFWYYLPVLILGFFPWIAFLPAAIAFAAPLLKEGAQSEPSSPLLRLSVAWIVMPLVFFSLAKTKLPNYIALAFPPLALLVALYFDSAVDRFKRRSPLVSSAMIPVTILLLAIAVAIFARNNRLTGDIHALSGDMAVIAALVFAGSLVTAVLFMFRSTNWFAAYALGGTACASILLLVFLVLPKAEEFKPVPRLAAYIQSVRQPGDAVAIEGVPGGNALLFYTQPPITSLGAANLPSSAAEPTPRMVICSSRRAFVVASRQQGPADPAYGRRRHQLLADHNDALFLYEGPACSTGGKG
ncbi:MAG: glycosyltransferase family 39 protein [Candidatus Eremiobacteraeota bacterium]|nr:glycosyltransferase family 39 protein [Candidatus Eremiobacteraeota bacterium]